MDEGLLKGLNEEQIKKIKACKGPEEALKLAKDEGIELNDEQLAAINGGCNGTTTLLKEGKCLCPYCHSPNTALSVRGGEFVGYVCYNCDKSFQYPYSR